MWRINKPGGHIRREGARKLHSPVYLGTAMDPQEATVQWHNVLFSCLECLDTLARLSLWFMSRELGDDERYWPTGQYLYYGEPTASELILIWCGDEKPIGQLRANEEKASWRLALPSVSYVLEGCNHLVSWLIILMDGLSLPSIVYLEIEINAKSSLQNVACLVVPGQW